MRRLLFCSFLLSTACLDALLEKAEEEEEEDEDEDEEYQEGDQQGDCLDGEDNDEDGDIDCEDDGCADKPACEGEEYPDINDTGSEPSGEPSEPSTETDSEPAEEPANEPTSEPSSDKAYITQNYEGTGVVNFMTTYEGTESYSTGVNQTAGTGNVETMIVWEVFGNIIENPSECTQCSFAFDVDLTYDASASTDPNGQGSDLSFSYALGRSSNNEYTLWYGNNGSWGEWLVNGQAQTDLNGTDHAQIVEFNGTTFHYESNIVDFYYYY